MSELIDELEVARWLVAEVGAATGLNVHLDVIPQNESLPAARITFQTRHDVYTVDAHAPMTRFQVLVVVTADNDQTSLADLRALEKALHDGLHRAAGVAGEARVLSCTRDYPWGMSEAEGGRLYRHRGGVYIIQARPVA